MFRKRPDDAYVGRHRVRVTSSGQHKRDPLPPPDIQHESTLLAAPTSEWYDPSRMQGIDPDLIAPVRQPAAPTRPNSVLEPRRKIKPRNITAAVFTAILAVPALGMAAWIVQHNNDESRQATSYNQLAPNTENVPMTISLNGQARQICLTVSNKGSAWMATANDWKC